MAAEGSVPALPSTVPAVRRSPRRSFGRDIDGYALVAPAVVGWAAIALLPLIFSIGLAFFRWNGIGTPRFAGVDNFYSLLVRDSPLRDIFYAALLRNLLLAVVVSTGTIAIAFPVSVALSSIRFLQAALRVTFLLPIVTSGIAVFYVWVFIFADTGPINGLFDFIGLHALAPRGGWLSSPGLAIYGVAVVGIWGTVPWAVLFYLAGLQGIDPALHEAAEIDGASWLQRLRLVSWPLLNSVTLIIVILLVVNLLQSYETVLLMTGGGPSFHTYVVGLVAYNAAYGELGIGGSSALGMATAIGWVLFFIFAGFTFVATRVFRDRT